MFNKIIWFPLAIVWHQSKNMIMHTHLKLSAFIASLCLMFSCNQANQQAPLSSADSVALPTVVPTSATFDNSSATSKDSTQFTNSTPTRPAWNQLLIRNAELTLNVKSASLFVSKIYRSTEGVGGFVLSENQTSSNKDIQTDMTIKVPVQRFDEVINQLCSGEVQVVEKSVSTTDVGTEMVDTKTRLENQKLLRNRYQTLLASAKTRTEVVELQQQVDQIQEQIDIALGRINYLTHQTSYSTIHIMLHQTIAGSIGNGNGFVDKIATAFVNGAGLLTGLLIGLATIWPLILVGIIIVFGYKWRKNKKQEVVSLKHG